MLRFLADRLGRLVNGPVCLISSSSRSPPSRGEIHTERWRNVFVGNVRIINKHTLRVLSLRRVLWSTATNATAWRIEAFRMSPPVYLIERTWAFGAVTQSCRTIAQMIVFLFAHTYFQTRCWRCRTSLPRGRHRSCASPTSHCPSRWAALCAGHWHKRRYNYCYYHYKRPVQSVWTSESLQHINNSTVALCYFFWYASCVLDSLSFSNQVGNWRRVRLFTFSICTHKKILN